MTKEDEKLLLEDLGARMIHGVIVNTPKGDGYLGTINLTIFGHELGVNVKATKRENFPLDECKPYLRPMSSMTEEERKECHQLQQDTIHVTFDKYDEEYEKTIDLPYFESLVDFYNSHHLDYRGLIEKGLAIEVTKDNNPYVM